MRTRKLFLTGALIGALIVLMAVPAFAAGLDNTQPPPPDVLAKANEFARILANTEGDFFVEQNVKGDVLRYGGISFLEGAKANYLVWGPWHSDPNWDGEGTVKEDRSGFPRARYIGYGYYGERVSNVFFPPDKPGDMSPLSSANFIKNPWNNSTVGRAFPQFFGTSPNLFNGTNNSDLICSMQWGLWYTAIANNYEPPDKNSDLYQNPQKYVHVFLPPSEETWGMGVLFHSSNGTLYYMSVPLLATALPELNPDDAISLTPQERTGQTGEQVNFDLKVNWKGIESVRKMVSLFGYDLGFVVQVSQQVNGTSYAIPFTLEGTASLDSGKGWSGLLFSDTRDAEKT